MTAGSKAPLVWMMSTNSAESGLEKKVYDGNNQWKLLSDTPGDCHAALGWRRPEVRQQIEAQLDPGLANREEMFKTQCYIYGNFICFVNDFEQPTSSPVTLAIFCPVTSSMVRPILPTCKFCFKCSKFQHQVYWVYYLFTLSEGYIPIKVSIICFIPLNQFLIWPGCVRKRPNDGQVMLRSSSCALSWIAILLGEPQGCVLRSEEPLFPAFKKVLGQKFLEKFLGNFRGQRFFGKWAKWSDFIFWMKNLLLNDSSKAASHELANIDGVPGGQVVVDVYIYVYMCMIYNEIYIYIIYLAARS